MEVRLQRWRIADRILAGLMVLQALSTLAFVVMFAGARGGVATAWPWIVGILIFEGVTLAPAVGVWKGKWWGFLTLALFSFLFFGSGLLVTLVSALTRVEMPSYLGMTVVSAITLAYGVKRMTDFNPKRSASPRG